MKGSNWIINESKKKEKIIPILVSDFVFCFLFRFPHNQWMNKRKKILTNQPTKNEKIWLNKTRKKWMRINTNTNEKQLLLTLIISMITITIIYLPDIKNRIENKSLVNHLCKNQKKKNVYFINVEHLALLQPTKIMIFFLKEKKDRSIRWCTNKRESEREKKPIKSIVSRYQISSSHLCVKYFTEKKTNWKYKKNFKNEKKCFIY